MTRLSDLKRPKTAASKDCYRSKKWHVEIDLSVKGIGMLTRLIPIVFLASTFLFLSLESSHACSCPYQGAFPEYSKGQTVIRGKVESLGQKLTHGENLYETMTVSIDKIIQGTFEHPIIEFEGDPGHLCLTYVDSDTYAIGSEHLFTVFSKDKKQGLGGCGEVSVSIVGNNVKGRKLNDAEDDWIQYSEDYSRFIQSLTAPTTPAAPILLPKSKPKP